MSTSVISVTVDEPVSEVARLMCAHSITGVPVVDGNRVVGIVTEVDIVSREIEVDPPAYGTFLDAIFRLPWDRSDDEIRRVLAVTAGDLMTAPVETVTTDATIQDVANLMFKHKVNPVPVVDKHGRLAGIVSRSDIVRLMVDG
ncbi:MAG TPA: CBS domain-containing protein [Thermomicrobiales bacterium]|nr:CBS domain-containing protein [Thermomicrobiales bacterium]